LVFLLDYSNAARALMFGRFCRVVPNGAFRIVFSHSLRRGQNVGRTKIEGRKGWAPGTQVFSILDITSIDICRDIVRRWRC